MFCVLATNDDPHAKARRDSRRRPLAPAGSILRAVLPVNAPNVLTVVRKAKTIVQVAAIFFAIAYDPTPGWVVLLVCGAVAITVASGIHYVFGLRRLMREAQPGAPAQ
jgi:hypothetical protein